MIVDQPSTVYRSRSPPTTTSNCTKLGRTLRSHSRGLRCRHATGTSVRPVPRSNLVRHRSSAASSNEYPRPAKSLTPPKSDPTPAFPRLQAFLLDPTALDTAFGIQDGPGQQQPRDKTRLEPVRILSPVTQVPVHRIPFSLRGGDRGY